MSEGKMQMRLKPNLLWKLPITQLILRLMRLVCILFNFLFPLLLSNKKKPNEEKLEEIFKYALL
jgi:hypothetical protein